MNLKEKFAGDCSIKRIQIKDIEQCVRRLRDHRLLADVSLRGPDGQDQAIEIDAQLVLAVRALEDARMRLGKAIQYAGDGVSKYDKDA